MAYTCAEFAAPVETVFAVLTDPTTYPSWLIGAADIRSIDRSWPAPGSRFHHRVGVGPFTQLSALAKMRADEVLPTPRAPVNK